MRSKFDSKKIMSAILKNDYAPGGENNGIYMKESTNLNKIEPLNQNIKKLLSSDQSIFFYYLPVDRNIDGEGLVFTNKGIFFIDAFSNKGIFFDYDSIYRISKELRKINIYSFQKIFDVNINDITMCNYINGLLRDIYLTIDV